MRILLVLLLLVASAAVAKEEVYKWVDENGVVHYTDKPPSDNAAPAKLPPLQTYKGGSAPDLRKFDKGPQDGKPYAGLTQVQVVTPSHDETFRGGERTVPIAVVVTPSLREGQQLIYVVDGKPQSLPTTDTSYALTNVDRGSHSVAVTVVDATGRELGRSGTVTFHMKPPIAKQ
jgi:hypothetical protein